MDLSVYVLLGSCIAISIADYAEYIPHLMSWGICMAISVATFTGFTSSIINWVKVRRDRVKFILSLVDKMNHEKSPQKIVSFTVNDSDTSATIVYERLGKQYILLFPYNRGHVVKMNQFRVELLRSGGQLPPLDITQQPGLPYLVHADILGGDAIRIINQETGASHIYGKHQIPMYGEEVMCNE